MARGVSTLEISPGYNELMVALVHDSMRNTARKLALPAQFLNTPVLMLWLVDRMVVGRWWRRQQPQVHRISLSADYMLLCWDQKIALPRAIAPELYFRLVDSGCMERAHVVTGFQKRLPGLALPGMPPTAQAAPGAGRTSPPAQSPGLQAGQPPESTPPLPPPEELEQVAWEQAVHQACLPVGDTVT